LFSFLLTYKTLEAEATIDFRQVEFFIKGPLTKYHASKKKPKMKPKLDNIGKTEDQIRKEFAAKRTEQAPWVQPKTWKLIDKLSKITPFDQPNSENDSESLAVHVANNQGMWHSYVYKDREDAAAAANGTARPA